MYSNVIKTSAVQMIRCQVSGLGLFWGLTVTTLQDSWGSMTPWVSDPGCFFWGVCILLLKDVRYAQISCQSCLSEPVLGEERLTWFGLVKGWDWDDARYSDAYHRRRYGVQWCVSVWVWLRRPLYSSAVWDSCFSYRLRTWCTNWYCSHVWIIPPLQKHTER